MRKSISIFIVILFCFELNAQDTNIVKYLPLKVGNVWVYSNGGWGIGKSRLKITSTLIANGHLYYIFNLSGDSCHCAQGTYTPFLATLAPMRIDSITGNLMFYGSSCQWQINEHLLDSLKTRVGDINNNYCNFVNCYDTNMQNIFGSLVKTKRLGIGIMTYYTFRRYAYNIGLLNSSQGCYYSVCGYNLLGCVIDGIAYGDTSFPVGINKISSEIPEEFSLSQNYPNPFNPVTKIKFDIPAVTGIHESRVQVVILDVQGREAAVLVNEQLKPGTYEVAWDASKFASAVYFYKLSATGGAGDFSVTKKMILIK